MKKMPNDESFERLVSRSIADMPVKITLPPGNSNFKVEYRLNSKSITSTVLVQQKPISIKPPSHLTPAGSRAWWALGQFWLAVNNYEGAIICAKTGLEELGDDYADPMAIDDTSMKLWVAEERIQKGHLSDGADMMLRILESRRNFTAEQQKNSPLNTAVFA